MNTKRVFFPNADGHQLAARLELPDDERPVAFALFAHCFTCSKDLKAAVRISRALSSRRIAVLRFDFTGLGESEGEFSSTTFSSEVNDVVAAARFLEREYAAPRLLVGHSLGGMAVLAAAAAIPSTAAVASIAAPSHPAGLRRLLGESVDRIEREGGPLSALATGTLPSAKGSWTTWTPGSRPAACAGSRPRCWSCTPPVTRWWGSTTLPRFIRPPFTPRASSPSTLPTTCSPTTGTPATPVR